MVMRDALHCVMIGSFKHRGLKRFFEENDPRRLPPDMVDRIKAILARLHQAETIEDMNILRTGCMRSREAEAASGV